jgi:hypothetical protein
MGHYVSCYECEESFNLYSSDFWDVWEETNDECWLCDKCLAEEIEEEKKWEEAEAKAGEAAEAAN